MGEPLMSGKNILRVKIFDVVCKTGRKKKAALSLDQEPALFIS